MQSQNGYSVVSRDECKDYEIFDGFTLALRDDDCGYILAHFLRRFHKRVETLTKTDTFGYSLRRISGTDEWSNHASATAADANSTQHQQGQTGTYTPGEQADLDDLLEEYNGVLRWGGTYRSLKDEMHFEINKPYDEVHLLARALKRNGAIYLSRLEPGNRNVDVFMLKLELHKRGLYNESMTNYFGVALRNAYAEWQRSLGFTGADADGIPGATSLEALGFTVKEG